MNNSPSDNIRDYDELRRLLLGPEIKKLEGLVQNPDQFSSEISKVLPDAMLKSAEQGEKLSLAMLPTVEQIVSLSINRDINKFANALFPVIGPAIRKSIAEAFRQMMQSLNQVLEYGLSWQGLKWRIESMRSGIPFAQIILLHSLQFRVEQVFLIHRETGLLLSHLELIDNQNKNADMVSSMLSAIGDFVGDSFETESHQTLGSIQVGDFSIWIEQGPDVVLAIAIRGDAPTSLRETMQQTLEDIQSGYEHDLASFKGDTAPFEQCRELLSDCMQSRQVEKQQQTSLTTRLIALLVLILLGYWLASTLYHSKQQNDYLALLEQEPGIILTQVSRDNGRLLIKGLRDPLARDPSHFIALSTLGADEVSLQFKPYQSMEHRFVEQRLLKILNPPENVSMVFRAGLLEISGFASEQRKAAINAIAPVIAGVERVDSLGLSSHIDLSSLTPSDTVQLSLDIDKGLLIATGSALNSWRDRARSLALKIPGIRGYDDSRLQSRFDFDFFNPPETVSMTLRDGILHISGMADNEWIESVKVHAAGKQEIRGLDLSQLINSDIRQLQRDIQALEEEMIFFTTLTRTSPDSGAALKRIATLTKSIIAAANKHFIALQIVVKGHSDSVGNYQDNVLLSLERADYVAQYLFNQGTDPGYIIIEGLDGPVEKERSAAEQRYNRRVGFKVLSGIITNNQGLSS